MNSVERIKCLCKERKISIAKLERDCGFANGYIGQLRKGMLPADRLKTVSEYLNVSINKLLGENEQKESAIVSDDALDKELIELLTRLTPAQEENVVSYIKFLLSNPEA